jgi:hypothetical protein
MNKPITQKTIEEMTFDELAQWAAHRIHAALLEEGGKGLKREVHLWLSQAILWNKAQPKN